MIEFDKALSDFLDSNQCDDEVYARLYEAVRFAFTAGWNAAMASDGKKVIDMVKTLENP